MDFVMDLQILTNLKKDNYNSILIIVDSLTRIVYYKLVKIIINVSDLIKIIINVVIRHDSLSDSIIMN